ncbi:MAG: hypothetical protein CL432_09600 [Acidimicrobiaceae bacterium]|jgi:ElaB/YqjD/DUF883 family membrane-anchored ribosome-binding protein|nr:hypothetical protein [Acidimicrobiaceae bacterium]|tara:strand:- start:503 stop:745 length:243 start_codon:yes stop_codon:yes gene_type:complete
MDNIKNLHETANEVLAEAAVSQLAVKSMEDVAKRANSIARWARNNADMESSDTKTLKAMAKEVQKLMDKWVKGSWEMKHL